MKHTVESLRKLLEKSLKDQQYGEHPKELYEPIRYIMKLGGKRMRPILVLLGYSLYKDDVEEILERAMAIEVFHNFTLMHDDIMDEAPLRRGKATVHEKWNANTAILSGDVMLVKAYDMLLGTPTEQLPETIRLFNKCGAEVCEGQQLDMVFETKRTVSEEEYLEMIKLKTAVLLGTSLELGALWAGADEKACKALYQFGVSVGIGFQLMDDLLDVYADQAKFGKQVGGDIIANKKTFLLIKALEKAKGATKTELNKWLKSEDFDPSKKVEAVTAIYNKLQIKELTSERMNEYFDQGFKALSKVDAGLQKKGMLKRFAESLIHRES